MSTKEEKSIKTSDSKIEEKKSTTKAKTVAKSKSPETGSVATQTAIKKKSTAKPKSSSKEVAKAKIDNSAKTRKARKSLTQLTFKKKGLSSKIQGEKFGEPFSSRKERIKIPKSSAHFCGKRKSAIAKVWLWENKNDGEKGFISVNSKDPLSYFLGYPIAMNNILKPFSVIHEDFVNYNIICKVQGGGLSAQSEAIRLGLAKCILAIIPNARPALKAESLLTRDSRTVESKKTGLRGARAKKQFSKR